MWNDLSLVSDFIIDTFGSIASLLTTTILCVTIVFFLLRMVIKIFKRIV